MTKVTLHTEIRKRYLNYALSVIRSRALPDARDGLKPVQRRILYAMYHDLKLKHNAKFRKSAAIVGATMGTYHTHGDSALYDSMVRMAQPWALRYPLIDGHGNFGSIDGDNAASARYTEARLLPLAERMMEDLYKDTIEWVPNYDNTTREPSVLPSKFPNLLVNGSTGIAVGMATNIPPHNLGEIVNALVDLIKNRNRTASYIVEKHICGPDFPTGGTLLESQAEIIKAYEKGSGTFTVRSKWHMEGNSIVITEIPYATNKDALIQKIAEHINGGHIPLVTDLRDESGDDIRVVFDLKRGANPEPVLAYLFKNTGLESKFHMNLTCLMPNGEPAQVGLITLLETFLDFRFEVTQKSFQHTLRGIEARLRILSALEKVFNALPQTLEAIQKASSKQGAKDALVALLGLDDDQAESVVSMPLYRLSNTEKEGILSELQAKRLEADGIQAILGDPQKIWEVIRKDLKDLAKTSDMRRTVIGQEVPEFELNEEDLIEAEDVVTIVTRDGWVRNQKSYSDVASLRCREDDEIGWVLKANTKQCVLFFTSSGRCYTTRINSLPTTTGYGDPIQSMFNFEDGERIVRVLLAEDTTIVSITKLGMATRYETSGLCEPSTVTGRACHRLGDNDHVLYVGVSEGNVSLATYMGRGITFGIEQIPVVKSVAKGVKAISLNGSDRVLAALVGKDKMYVETNREVERMITGDTYPSGNRGRKGYDIIKRGTLTKWTQSVVEA